MPQKRMAARGQSAKVAKVTSSKVSSKAPVAKKGSVSKALKVLKTPVSKVAKKAEQPLKSARPPGQIEQAKAALKKESASTAATKVKTDVPTEVKVEKAAGKVPTGKVPKEGKGRGRKISIEINPNEAASALSGKWSTLYKKSEQIEAKPYNMKAVFEEKTAIVHKVLGWGYILANRNDRLEVLFKDGIKYLISNYKP